MSYQDVNQAALAAELAEGPHGRRIVRVFSNETNQAEWIGLFGGAPIEPGEPGYQFSDGEKVTL